MARSSYIIICDVELALLNAQSPADNLIAASRGAKELVAFIELRNPELTQADVQSISDLQHEFMDHWGTWKKDKAKAKAADMIVLLRQLSEKFEEDESEG